MLLFSPEIEMNEEEFRLLRDFVYQQCGLHFTPDSKYLLEKRLAKRVQFLKLKNFKDYYLYLRYNQDRTKELTEVIDSLTTNETYFFREDFQLKTFIEEIIPEIVKRKRSQGEYKVRIWSAGCSTGEEPYTIAMLLLEKGCYGDIDFEIIGTDINQRVLNTARTGSYGSSSFRVTDKTRVDRFFIQDEAGKCQIREEVKALVSISHLNLFDKSRIALLGRMDVVFCRNVIIYFDIPGKKRVVESFYERLRPEGYLLLGHSESLMNLSTSFVLRHFLNDMVYQRPELAPFSLGGNNG